MPLKRCQRDGKDGWKYGDSGRCYTGPDAKEKARKQGVAIKISQQQAKSDLKDYFDERLNNEASNNDLHG